MSGNIQETMRKFRDKDTTDHLLLSNIGTTTHADIDTHISDTTNPHEVSLSEIENPEGDKTFTMANKLLAFRYTAPTPAGDFAGAFEIEATGGFTGNLLHIHQHTGGVGTTDLVSIEAEDSDVTCLRINHTQANAICLDIDDALTVDKEGDLITTGDITSNKLILTGNSSIISSDHAINLRASGDGSDYVSFTATSNIPELNIVGGNILIIKTIGGSDLPTLRLQGSGSEYGELSYSRASSEFELSSDDKIAIESGGAINFKPSGDLTDYIQLSTTGNVPRIGTVGTCDLKLTASSGEIDFEDDNFSTTGDGTCDQLTITNQSRCRVYENAGSQTIPHNTWTLIEFDTAEYDSQSEFNLTTERFTAKTAGYRIITAFARFSGIDDGIAARMAVHKNGATIGAHFKRVGANTNIISHMVTSQTYLAVNDYIEIWVHHATGTDEVIMGGQDLTWCAIHRLS